jgi:transcriptional regulator with XRE-family HTH domain
MLPICSFSLKPKIREITRIPRVTNTIGDHIRKQRLERNIDQQDLAKQFRVSSIALSNWELNRKPTPPKHLQNIIYFLGYVPKIKIGFDRFGTYTQLYRKQQEISLQKFSEHINIDIEEIKHLEQGKYGKRHRQLESEIMVFIKE